MLRDDRAEMRALVDRLADLNPSTWSTPIS